MHVVAVVAGECGKTKKHTDTDDMGSFRKRKEDVLRFTIVPHAERTDFGIRLTILLKTEEYMGMRVTWFVPAGSI